MSVPTPSSSSSLSFSSALSKSLTAGSEWPDKEAFLDSLYWLRQVVGVLLGLAFGVMALRGAPALALFAACNAAAGYVYCVPFQRVDEEVAKKEQHGIRFLEIAMASLSVPGIRRHLGANQGGLHDLVRRLPRHLDHHLLGTAFRLKGTRRQNGKRTLTDPSELHDVTTYLYIRASDCFARGLLLR